jgi:hypothetical protein
VCLHAIFVPPDEHVRTELEILLEQVLAGRHDNQVDAIGLVGQLLDTMVRPAPTKPVVRPRRDWWDRKEERAAVNWKTV